MECTNSTAKILLYIENNDRFCRNFHCKHVFLQFCVLKICRNHHLGVVEVVVVGDILSGEDASAHCLGLHTVEVDGEGLGLVKAYVGERHDDASVGLLGG